nr:glycosyltransferase 87 family protein [Streptoalloteichus tenebrarius]
MLGLAMTALAIRANAIDLEVYRAGGRAVLDGGSLYDRPVWNAMHFTYTPWAALLFAPLAAMPAIAARTLLVLANCALLVFVVWRSWRWLDASRRRRVPTVCLVIASLSLLSESVHATVYVGQINLVLLALIIGDLVRDDRRRTMGVGVGIAAGIKLTPLIFLPYLLLTRRYRAAAVATCTFLGTVLVGFVLLPREASRYWFGGLFADTSRIYANLTSTHNQSLRGMILRLGVSNEGMAVVWPLLALVVAAGVFATAMWASRRGEHFLGVVLCGMASAAISPWSWGHHWVWLVPLAVYLLHLAARRDWSVVHPAWLGPAVLLPLTFPWVLALADPPDSARGAVPLGGPIGFVLGNLYVFIFVATVLAVVLHLRRHDQRAVGEGQYLHDIHPPSMARRGVA